jgi:hypothetical protein
MDNEFTNVAGDLKVKMVSMTTNYQFGVRSLELAGAIFFL